MSNPRQPDYLILSRRQEEAARVVMAKTVKEYANLKQKVSLQSNIKSHFEESTQIRIDHNHHLKRFRELKQRDDEHLEARRERSLVECLI
jgi:hypothetical protein